MSNFRKATRKTISIVLSVVLLIVLAGFAVLYFGAQSYLNRNLSDLVNKKSKGKYELSFNSIEINFQDWGIVVNDVSFHPSDSIISSLKTTVNNKQFYSFRSPQISLSGIAFLKLFMHKKLDIGEILVSEPELNIHGKQDSGNDKPQNINSVLLELKPLVTEKFKSITIGKIELQNASYDFYNLLGDSKKLANAQNITVGILNFYTDSVLLPDPNRMFDAADIYFRMQNYHHKLADSIHAIHTESITYSLKRSVIEASNFELKPNDSGELNKGQYYFRIPHFKLTTRHIKDFYRNNSIPIDTLEISDAEIKYWPKQPNKTQNAGASEEFDLNDLIKNEFSGINVQDMRLNHARINIYRTRTDTTSQQELKDVTIRLNDFRLDSITQTDTSRVFYARNIAFSAAGYEILLGDKHHRIKAKNLELSTAESLISIKDIQVFPSKLSQGQILNSIDASCDSVRFDRFNFKKAYHQKRFLFQKINLYNPEVKLTQNTASSQKNDQDSSFVYRLMAEYIKGVYASQVIVQKGKVQLVNKTGVLQTGNIESAVKLKLYDFALDEMSIKRTDRLFYANQIELNFDQYQMQLADQLHKLTIDNLSISTRNKNARLQNLHLFPISKENTEETLKQYGRSELYEFTVPELSLSNADFHNAFFNKKFSVDSLSIKMPQIYYENFQLLRQKPEANFQELFRLLSDYLSDVHINLVEIPEGTIRFINHNKKARTISLDNKFSLRLENTQIDDSQFNRNKLLFSENVDLAVRDHLIRLSDNVHVLKAGEIGFSTRNKEIFVVNARLFPETSSKEFTSIPWIIQLSIPEIRIKGINMDEVYFNNNIDAENLKITAPDIKLYQKLKSDQKKDIKEVVVPLPKEIESIAVRNFLLTDGSLKVFSELSNKPNLLIQSDIKMDAQNIVIRKNKENNTPEFVSGDYTGKLIQLKFTPKDKNQLFGIDELIISTKDRQIQARNLTVGPKSKNSKSDQFELQIPALTMSGLDMDKAYRGNQYLFESIIVDRPVFKFSNNGKDSVEFNPYKLNLYPYFESFADVFYANKLTVKTASVSITQGTNTKFQQIMDMSLSKIRIEDKPSTGFLHAQDFSFKIRNWTRPEKFYQYKAAELGYSSARNVFTAKNIWIEPRYDKYDFSGKISYQTDHFSGKIDSVSMLQPQIKRWFDQKEITGKSLVVYGLDMNIFRDKRNPLDEKRRPKMLQEMIKSIQYPVSVDSIVLANAKIEYSERTPTSDGEGKIYFTDIQARLKPFSNIKSTTGKYQDLSLTGNFSVMDSCRASVSMNYFMNDAVNSFNAKGNLSQFNMHILNPVLEPLARVSIRSGNVNQFNFDFAANNTQATGNLFFGYDNLKISVLEMKDGNTKEARFASFLANSLLLRGKNPRGKELLPDEINFQRDQKRSVINYWWKSVFSGVRNTLGIKENKQEERP